MINSEGRSEVLKVLSDELVHKILYSTNSKILELQQTLNHYYDLNDLSKKTNYENKIDNLAFEIFKDKSINSLNHPKYYNKIFFPLFEKVIEKKNLEIFPLASFFVRLNLPNYKSFYSNWHQDAATFLYNKSKYFRFKSYTLWVAITDATKNNSLEFIDKNFYKDKLYDCKFEISERHGEVRFKESILPSVLQNKNKILTKKFDFRKGQGIIFDSLIFHRTVRNNEKIRLSFDLRIFSNQPSQIIKNISFKNLAKRKLFENFNYKFIS